MTGIPIRILLVFILFAVSICLESCEQAKEAAIPDGRVKVVASIFPLADFVRNVGRDRVEVITLLPPAASPHVYSPAPRDLARVQGARLFVKVGLGFEFWAEDLARTAGEEMIEVDTSAGVVVIQEAEHGHDQGHNAGNPHTWLDPMIAMSQVRSIAQALKAVDPDHGPEYEKNAAHYLKQLSALDLEIRTKIEGFEHKSFIAFHPSWSYFARRYGLVQAGVIESSPGREPAPGELMEIIQTVRESGVKVVFAEPQLNPKAAHVIASEVGARVFILDPIGSPDHDDRSTYLKLMRYNLTMMEQGMGHP